MEYPVQDKDFINIALSNRKWCYTSETFSIGDKIEFTNRDMGGHCKVRVIDMQEGRVYWKIEELDYINPGDGTSP